MDDLATVLEDLSLGHDVSITKTTVTVLQRRSGTSSVYERRLYPSLDRILRDAEAGTPPRKD